MVKKCLRCGSKKTTNSEFSQTLEKMLRRYGCKPEQLQKRYVVVPDFTHQRWKDMIIYNLLLSPTGKGMSERMGFYDKVVKDTFGQWYKEEVSPPEQLLHVSCTGYVSPSGAQHIVSQKGWGKKTEVTHVYHMGCYGSLPALRIAQGFLNSEPGRVDIAHTELCSLHFNPAFFTPEQGVVQTLFGDGLILYRAVSKTEKGLRLIGLKEVLISDTESKMTWGLSDWGMQMTLSADVPRCIQASLKNFIDEFLLTYQLNLSDLTVCAVHPGGPKIINEVQEVLNLSDHHVKASRKIFFEHGNMSSATLPFIWKNILEDTNILDQSYILSLAFGPGLTVSAALFQKHWAES